LPPDVQFGLRFSTARIHHVITDGNCLSDVVCHPTRSPFRKSAWENYIELLKIDDLIDGCTTADDADRSKPAPDIFTAALEKVNVSAGEAITVGDTRFDIEAAAKAGLGTIALTCGGTDESVLRKAGAIAVFRDPAHLLAEYDTVSDLRPPGC
jgi:beta-phosphoglucomutase-like phosphatase (HAD superfamily)